ncbi:MAG TPA: ATP-binding protein [Steroidobacteraceae bacterium]|nr:ATP-binding protein [Steroidobacteraceae bacterium]
MKDSTTHDAISVTARRVSRILASVALVAGAGLLAGWAYMFPWVTGVAGALPPPLAALAIALLGLAVLLTGLSRPWLRLAGFFVAALAGGIALQALVQTIGGADFATDRLLFGATVTALHGGLFPQPGRIAGVVALMLLSNSLALLLVPAASRHAARGFAVATSVGLLLFTTSLVGLALENPSLASLGFDRVPTLAATLLSATLLLGTLGLRRDAGWLTVLWQSSATGGLARGMVVWTVLAPLAFALIALAGVRTGFFSLDFAFALLAAAMCGGLTFLVLWNATRVDRATRRAEAAREVAQQAANRLRLAQTATGVQMWEWSVRSRQWLSLDGEERLDPSTNEYLEAGLARCLRDGHAEFEFPVRRPGIEDQWMLASCWRESRDGVVVIAGVNVDVTERKFAILALEASETRLQLAAQALPGFVYDWNRASGKLVRTSGIEQLLGYSGAEISLASRWWDGLIHPDDVASARPTRVDAVSGAGHDDNSIACEYRVRHRDGRYVWIWDHCILVRDRAGEVTRVVGSVLDITDRKETLARLAASERQRENLLNAERAARAELGTAGQAKDEFLATISHELRTPLNAILGWATLLQRPNVDPAMIGDGLKVIERNARAQTALLGDLLDANQMMSGKLSLTFEPMDLNDAVRATLDSLRVTIATRKVQVDSRLAAAALPVMGDSGRLQQIVGNLLSNALKFTPAGGVVSVSTGRDDDGLWCQVRDSGEGIAAEFLPHIFEKFRQAEGGSSRKFAGLGLGLAITKQLVESHGGSIGVASEGQGRGAVFTVRLPQLRADGTDVSYLDAPRSAGRSDKPLAGLTILAVDDEPDSREYLERLLSEQGAEIVSVASAREAIEAISRGSGRFNLLVSDIGMPESTGYDLIDTVRRQLKVDGTALPAVALTAFTRAQDRTQALERGFQNHLAKPVQVGRLIGAIRQLTGRADPGADRLDETARRGRKH